MFFERRTFILCQKYMSQAAYIQVSIGLRLRHYFSNTKCYSDKNKITKPTLARVLLRNSGCVIKLIAAQRNASKFAIFYIFENPKLLFPFFISCYFIFPPNKCPGLCRHRPEHSLWEKIKQYEMKNGKSNFGFSYI